MVLRRRHLIAAVALGAVLGLPGLVSAQPARVADDPKLRAGIALFEAHKHARALVEFERLHTTSKHARALYWIGRTHEESGRPLEALRAFKGYEREAGPLVDTDDGLDLMRRIQLMTMQVAVVTVTAGAGSKILVDGDVVGAAPLTEPIYVNPGPHTISAEGADPKTVELTVDSRISVELLPAEGGAAEPRRAVTAGPTVPARATSSGATFVTVGGLAVAGLLTAGSVYFAAKSADSASSFARRRTELGASRSELEGLQSDTRLNAGVALGLGLSALATAGLTLFVFRKAGAAEPHAGVVATGRGLELGGRF